MVKRILNAQPSLDPRNKNFLTSARIKPQKRVSKIWRGGPVLDQGRTPACGGFSWAAEYLAAPKGDFDATAAQGYDLGMMIYNWSVSYASQAGMGPGGGEFGVRLGLIEEYRWPETQADLIDAIISEGPALLTIPWFDSMRVRRRDGRLMVPRMTDHNPGFHALLIRGYDPAHAFKAGWRRTVTKPAFLLRNSWGRGWGKNGDAWITAHDLDKLVHYRDRSYINSTCVPIGRKTVDIDAILTAGPPGV